MSDNPTDLKYTDSHEWVKDAGDGTYLVGITHHAQEALGDIVFVEPPEVGAEFAAGDESGTIESVKAASDIYCPLKGKVAKVNERLADEPALVNTDPYGDGWLFALEGVDKEEFDKLMSAADYESSL